MPYEQMRVSSPNGRDVGLLTCSVSPETFTRRYELRLLDEICKGCRANEGVWVTVLTDAQIARVAASGSSLDTLVMASPMQCLTCQQSPGTVSECINLAVLGVIGVEREKPNISDQPIYSILDQTPYIPRAGRATEVETTRMGDASRTFTSVADAAKNLADAFKTISIPLSSLAGAFAPMYTAPRRSGNIEGEFIWPARTVQPEYTEVGRNKQRPRDRPRGALVPVVAKGKRRITFDDEE